VLSNDGVKTKNFRPVAFTYGDWGAKTWDSTRSSIGWNWKEFNQNTFVYNIVDSSVYFIKALSGDIYKLYFTRFDGSSTGVIGFTAGKEAGVGINEQAADAMQVTVYPNPVRNRINLSITGKSGEDLSIVLTDLSGRQLRADRPGHLSDGLNVFSLDVAGVQPGTYLVLVSAAAMKSVTKVIITE